jgi:hypothetical protein
MLGHAGDVEVFEDSDGWLCVRTKLMRTGDIVHEPAGDGTPKQDRARIREKERTKIRRK